MPRKKFDIFLSYASEDKDEVAGPIMHALWKIGVKHFWVDYISILPSESIPVEIDRGIAESRYMISIITNHYLKKEWTRKEYDAVVMGKEGIIPVWCNVTPSDVKKFSPVLASRKAILWKGDPDEVAANVSWVLMHDKRTDYYKCEGERKEIQAFWNNILVYIAYTLGVFSEEQVEQIAGEGGISEWMKHFERHGNISQTEVLRMRNRLDFLNDDDAVKAIALLKKAEVTGWAPYYPWDEPMMEVLRNHGLW